MSVTKFVYLAGPILGQTEDEANDWRYFLAGQLEAYGLRAISPLRCEPIHGETYTLGYADPRFGTPRAIFHKNMYDVQTCDAILAYIPRPKEGCTHSFGTMAELSWARAMGKLTILVSDDPAIRNHPVMGGQAGWVFDNFDDAIDTLTGVLGGYVPGGKHV